MKTKMSVFLIITFFMLYFTSVANAVDKTPEQIVREAKAAINEVSVGDVKKMIDNKEDMILLDVRDREEYEMGHIPNAINISRGTLVVKVNPIIPDKNKKIIVYCGTDLLGPLATKSLNDLGYKKAVNMVGGLKAWKEAGYPVSKLTAADIATSNMASCSEEVVKFCKNVQQGSEWKCLQKHENELSASCKEFRARMLRETFLEDRKKKIQFRNACNDDIFSFCERVRSRGNAVQKCLKKHENELSDSCREQIEQESVMQMMFILKYW